MKIPFLAKICLIWGIFWGTLSTGLFFLGLAHLWYSPVMIIVFVLSLVGLAIYLIKIDFFKQTKTFFTSLKNNLFKDKIVFLLVCLISLTILFYLIGTIAPEKEFDALWYHLTLPKLFLMDHQVHYVPGGLFYYSVMPQLAEMLYGLSLAFISNGILAKLLHFSFGIMWLIFSYEILRLFFRKRLSLILTLIISSLAVVCFLSTSAYIDLIVAFYVSGLIWNYLNFIQTKDIRYLYLAAVFAGFSLAAKIYGLIIFGVLWLVLLFQRNWKALTIFSAIALALVFPYYLHAFFTTGNPIYPVLSVPDQSFKVWISGANNFRDWLFFIWPQKILGLTWRVLVYEFAPIFGLILLVPFYLKKQSLLIKQVLMIFLIFLLFWSLHPVWEPRYLMVILPLFAVLTGSVLQEIKFLGGKIIIGILILAGLIFSFQANWKHLAPAYLLLSGKINHGQYLNKYIGSDWYNFIDEQNIIKTNANNKLLTINYHNLFYAPTNIIDWSYYHKKPDLNLISSFREDKIAYIAIAKYPLNETLQLSDHEMQNLELIYQKGEASFYKVKPESS